MKTAAAAIAVTLLAVSWIAASGVALLVEYVGWRLVISDHQVVGGLFVAVLLVGPAFMLTQTVIGALAIPFGMYAEREDNYGGQPQ